MSGVKGRHSLTSKERYRFFEWLTANWTMLEQERLSTQHICDRIKADTGIDMSPLTLQRQLTLIGKTLPRAERQKPKTIPASSRLCARAILRLTKWQEAIVAELGPSTAWTQLKPVDIESIEAIAYGRPIPERMIEE